jgi:putative spermidine/putrescine transport system permease protein
MDLGADTLQTFRRITLPQLGTALVAGGLLAFALSFDELIVTNFLAGGVKTLPIWILSNFRLANQAPVVNVAAMFAIFLSIIPVYIAQRLAGAESATTR